MTIPLLKALPELKRKEDGNLYPATMYEGKCDGYNQAISELEKYEFCEDAIRDIIWKKMQEAVSEEGGFVVNFSAQGVAKELLASLPAWLRRKES